MKKKVLFVVDGIAKVMRNETRILIRQTWVLRSNIKIIGN
jgi:hypothetical protein